MSLPRQVGREETPTPQVLFVCAHGAAKSVLAASYFNLLAERRGLSIRAIARGTDPDTAVAEGVAGELRRLGAPVCVDAPTRISDADVSRASVVVLFDQPGLAAQLRGPIVATWDGLPALSANLEGGRAAIVAKTEALLAELEARHVAGGP